VTEARLQRTELPEILDRKQIERLSRDGHADDEAQQNRGAEVDADAGVLEHPADRFPAKLFAGEGAELRLVADALNHVFDRCLILALART
jgi:hypothetical protein